MSTIRYIPHIGIVACIVAFSPTICAAVAYTQPLTNIPGVTDPATLQSIADTGLVGFINGIIRFIFTGAAIASTVMLVLIGFQYVVAEKSAASIGALREKIESVAWGVGIVLSTWIVLNAINPNLIGNLNLFKSIIPPPIPPSTATKPASEQPLTSTYSTKDDPQAFQNAEEYWRILSASCPNAVNEHKKNADGTTTYYVYCPPAN